MAKNTEVNLKVMEAMQEEAYKGIVRIDSTQMKEIGIHAGDIVEIEGARKTVGIVDRAYPADIGQSIIRMDGILRRNAKTGIGEQIKVRKTEYKEAKKITIAPAQKGVMIQIQGNPEGIKRSLLGRAVVKGDILSLGGATRRSKTFRSSGSPFEDIFEQFGEMLGGAQGGFMGSIGALKFVVADSNPTGPVIITENTQLKISSKAIEIADEAPIPDVTYEDLGGLADEITKIREMVETPMKHPELFQALGIEPPKGVLLHGAPGTGKTLLAKAVANESEANFMLINGPEIMNKFYGESEKKIRQIFEEAAEKSPSIIFIDEIDAIASERVDIGTSGEREVQRTFMQLLSEIDGFDPLDNVKIIGATNRIDILDESILRPGRLDRLIHIPLPVSEARREIFNIHSRNMHLNSGVDVSNIVSKTQGFSGAEVKAVCTEAGYFAIRDRRTKILMTDFLQAIDKIKKEELDKEHLGMFG